MFRVLVKKIQKLIALHQHFQLQTIKLKENELKKLHPTAYDLFHLLSECAAFKSYNDDIKISFVNDQLQKIDTSSCRNYQIYFYKHLFDPLKTSKNCQ